MIQRALVLVACVALALGGCAGQSTPDRLDARLREADGEPDRGWGYLGKSAYTREVDNNPSRDVCDTVAANEATLGSSAGRVAWIDDSGALTETDLYSPAGSNPGLLRKRGSLNGRCFDGSD